MNTNSEEVSKYFTKEIWDAMSMYEKQRYDRIYTTFKNMADSGLNPCPPEFVVDFDCKAEKQKQAETEVITPSLQTKIHKPKIKKIKNQKEDSNKKQFQQDFKFQELSLSDEVLTDGLDPWSVEVLSSYLPSDSLPDLDDSQEFYGFSEDSCKRSITETALMKGILELHELEEVKPIKCNWIRDEIKLIMTNSEENNVNGPVQEESRRYPRRSVLRASYKELDLKRKCGDCLCIFTHIGECPDISTLTRKANTPSNKSVIPSIFDIEHGRVCCNNTIASKVTLGSYVGEVTRDGKRNSGFSWEMQSIDQQNLCVDGSIRGSWLRHINLARSHTQQNLTAVQRRGRIWYDSMREITSGEDLCVWYGIQYAMDVGLNKIYIRSVPKTSHASEDFDLRCDICGKGFAKSESLNVHRVRQHATNNEKIIYQCSLCTFKTPKKHKYGRHILIHSCERPYPCTECTKRFKQNAHLRRHLKVHSRQPYQCNICLDKLKTEEMILFHERYHKGLTPYLCVLCGKAFTRFCGLHNHRLAIHMKVTRFPCPICNKSFFRKRDLDIHMFVHTKQSNHKCPLCSRMFPTNWKLNKHLYTHARLRKKVCHICNRAFKKDRILSIHITKMHGISVHEREALRKCSNSSLPEK